MTARLFTLNPLEGFRPKTFAGHRDAVLAAYFSADSTSVSGRSFFCFLTHIPVSRYTQSARMALYLPGKQKMPPMMRIPMIKSRLLQLPRALKPIELLIHAGEFINDITSTNLGLKLFLPHFTLLQIFSLSVSQQASLGFGKCQHFQTCTL